MIFRKLNEVPVLTSATGDEAAVVISGEDIVKVPLDTIGSAEPVLLKIYPSVFTRDDLTTSVFVTYLDGSSITNGDIVSALIAGAPVVLLVTSSTAPTASEAYNVISATATQMTVAYGDTLKVIKYATEQT